MKRLIKRTLKGVTLLFMLLSFTGIIAFASEGIASDKTAPVVSDASADGFDAINSADTENPDTGTADNAFDSAFAVITEHSTEIFSALAFFGSMLVALVYKKGLSPLLSRAVDKIGGEIEKVKNDSDKVSEEQTQAICRIEEKNSIMNDRLTELSDRIERLSSGICSEEELLDTAKRAVVVISSQIDMLYDVFMSSSLPQYQKELMGEKVLRMKEELSANEKKQ